MFAGFGDWLLGNNGALLFVFAELYAHIFVTSRNVAPFPYGLCHRGGYDACESPCEWPSRLSTLAFGLVTKGRRQDLVVVGMLVTCAKYVFQAGASGGISGYFGSG